MFKVFFFVFSSVSFLEISVKQKCKRDSIHSSEPQILAILSILAHFFPMKTLNDRFSCIYVKTFQQKVKIDI